MHDIPADVLVYAGLVFTATAWIRKQWPALDGPRFVLPIVAVLSVAASWGLGAPAPLQAVLSRAAAVFVVALTGAELAKRSSAQLPGGQ